MKGLIAYQNDNDYLKMKTYEHQQTLKEETLSNLSTVPENTVRQMTKLHWPSSKGVTCLGGDP